MYLDLYDRKKNDFVYGPQFVVKLLNDGFESKI